MSADPAGERVEIGGVRVHRSIPALFQERARVDPERVSALRRDATGCWTGRSTREGAEAVRLTAQGLMALGVTRGDRVGILANTRPEWLQADLGALHLGAVTVGIYPTLPAEDAAYQLEHAGVEVLFVEDAEQRDKVAGVRAQLPRLRQLVLLESPPEGPGEEALSLTELETRGAALEDGLARFAAAWQALGPDDLATIVYTSGTTGSPKGAMLTHGNLVYTAQAAAAAFPHSEADTSVVFLPLAHSLQRCASYAGLHTRGRGYFTHSHHTLMEDIQAVEPSVQVSVPRIWEKLYTRLHEVLAAAPPRRRRIFQWGLRVGRESAPYRKAGRPLPLGLRFRHALARRLVHERLKRRVFGRNIRFLSSGGAPIDGEILEFFYALGLLVIEGWGLTETAAPATLNRPEAFRFGSVGRPLEGTELALDPADGELLVRGPGVFRGYYRDEEATTAAFTPAGFFRTGDIGRIDADGYVFITDRKKNIIVLSNGKNVAPQRVENQLKTLPLVEQVLVHGDRRSYLVGLLTLDPEEALPWAARAGYLSHGAGELRGEAALPALRELVEQPAACAAIDVLVREKNAGLPHFEQLKRWRLVPELWTPEDGSLTPTLKLKRRVLAARHRELLESLYAE